MSTLSKCIYRVHAIPIKKYKRIFHITRQTDTEISIGKVQARHELIGYLKSYCKAKVIKSLMVKEGTVYKQC